MKINLAHSICIKFNLGYLRRVSKINNDGFSNNCYRFITDKSKHFVKVYSKDKLGTILSTAKAELFFKKGSIPVLVRIKNMEESDHLVMGGKLFIVFPYIVIPKVKKWQKELYYEMGDFLGKMHEYSIKTPNKNNLETFRFGKVASLSLRSMRLLLDKLRNKRIIDKHNRLAISNLIIKIGYLKNILPQRFDLSDVALVHGDFHPGNLCIKGGKIKMIYDFDHHCYRSIYYELAKVIINTCFSGSFHSKNFIRTEYFLRGYQRHVTLNPDILKTAIKICHFEVFNSFWVETKLVKKPTDKLLKVIMEKEKQTPNYFMNPNNLNVFTERICNFLDKQINA